MPGKGSLELVVRFVRTLRLVILAGREVNQTPKMRFPWVPGSQINQINVSATGFTP